MLVDDDGRVYMYSGCNSNGNISVVELDPQTWQEIGVRVPAVVPDYMHRGFEVGGDNNELLDTPPWVEGAWMNKLGGVYFLQYAAYAYNFAVQLEDTTEVLLDSIELTVMQQTLSETSKCILSRYLYIYTPGVCRFIRFIYVMLTSAFLMMSP